MGFQTKAGSIILDATLTDVGRRHMSQGKLEITKYSLGDDEVDYSLGTRLSGEYLLDNPPPTFEAIADSAAAIVYGLIDFNRDDVLLLPEYKMNTSLKNTVSTYTGLTYLSVNDETTKKLSEVFGTTLSTYVLQTDMGHKTALVFESGIDSSEAEGSEVGQKRFIYNFDLYDKYVFAYLDSRFFDGLMTTNPRATEVRMNLSGSEVSDFQPLTQIKSISLAAPITNYDTYYCNSVPNNIFDDADGHQTALSEFEGPRSSFLPLNFVVNNKMRSRSNGTADVRYSKFGKIAQNVFGDGNLYDYVDTNIMIEGTSTARSIRARIRIIRFSGT